jgi:short-subunit dehydrogenase
MIEKVVVITGASSGIGLALARKYAQEGFLVVIAARRFERLIAIEEEFGHDCVLAVETDVTIEASCRNLIERTIEKFGRIDILINNAGVSMRASFAECDLSVFHRLMDVNFWGTVYCTKYALPYLLETNGSVVGVNSVVGYYGLPGRAGYSAAKFAARGFIESLRVEYRKSKLHVMMVAPGFVASEVRMSALTADGSEQGKSPRVEKKMMSAEKCALLIYKGIKKRKRTLILAFVEGTIAIFLSKWWPSFVDYVNYTILKKEPDCPF